jgi:hypothetical protein
MLHEGDETQGKPGKQDRTIVRRPIALAMGQGGSFEIGRQIFSDFVQAQTVIQHCHEKPLKMIDTFELSQ